MALFCIGQFDIQRKGCSSNIPHCKHIPIQKQPSVAEHEIRFTALSDVTKALSYCLGV
jgi:hypothetical protein